jgi:hypothetical protein
MDELRAAAGAPEAPRHAHEESDVNIRGIVIFTAALAATVALIIVVTTVILNGLQARRPKEVRMPASVEPIQAPPEPRLQTTPSEDLATMRAREDEILDHYGWIDRSDGVVRIPIERAIDIVAREGLPVAPPAASAGNPEANR